MVRYIRSAVANKALEISDIARTYSISTDLAAKVYECKKNVDSDKGYDLYYEIYKTVYDQGIDDELMYDLGSYFTWDERLDKEFTKRASAEGRYDLV